MEIVQIFNLFILKLFSTKCKKNRNSSGNSYNFAIQLLSFKKTFRQIPLADSISVYVHVRTL